LKYASQKPDFLGQKKGLQDFGQKYTIFTGFSIVI